MANGTIDSPFGVRSARSAGDSDRNGQLELCHVPATDTSAIFIGSPVVLAGSADPVEKAPDIALAAAGARVFGIVMGFRPLYGSGLNNDNRYRAGSTKRYAMVKRVMPSDVFEIQADGPLAATLVGQLFDLTAEAGNTTTGRSTVEIDTATAGTASGQVQLLGISKTSDNEFSAVAGDRPVALVTFNETLTSSEADGV